MARSRNIKPSIMDNEALAELEPLTRLLFVYLWMLADRDGRLEDRPKRIAAQALPYDHADVNAMLTQLHGAGFIVRYQANGIACIQVVNFSKHQTPHVRESAGSLPAQDESTTLAVLEHNLGSDETSPRSPDSLIPDSLIPDSLPTPDGVGGHRHDDAPHLALVSKSSQSIPDCPHLEILALWSTVLPALPRHEPDQWRGARADHLRARWRETATAKRWPDKVAGLAYLGKLFAYVGQSDFLTGRVTPRQPGRKPFVCTLAWLVKPENWAKTIEGEYHQDAA